MLHSQKNWVYILTESWDIDFIFVESRKGINKFVRLKIRIRENTSSQDGIEAENFSVLNDISHFV